VLEPQTLLMYFLLHYVEVMYVLNVTSVLNSMYITFEKYNSVFGLVP